MLTRGNNDAIPLSGALAGANKPLTAFPAAGLGAQLSQVAKIINVRGAMRMNRQIFFCTLGGFDTHSGQLQLQDQLLAELSGGLNAFYNATVEMQVDQQVTAFTSSDLAA